VIPLKVRFTGLEFDPMEVLQSRELIGSPIPPDWVRVRFDVPDEAVTKVRRWVAKNTNDRWCLYSFEGDFETTTVVIAFETKTDAVMFRLKNGETAWQNDEPNLF
jgi:hypothetical protein